MARRHRTSFESANSYMSHREPSQTALASGWLTATRRVVRCLHKAARQTQPRSVHWPAQCLAPASATGVHG
eukprot:366212-Chlamydomonas_euryale.AAC.11